MLAARCDFIEIPKWLLKLIFGFLSPFLDIIQDEERGVLILSDIYIVYQIVDDFGQQAVPKINSFADLFMVVEHKVVFENTKWFLKTQNGF